MGLSGVSETLNFEVPKFVRTPRADTQGLNTWLPNYSKLLCQWNEQGLLPNLSIICAGSKVLGTLFDRLGSRVQFTVQVHELGITHLIRGRDG